MSRVLRILLAAALLGTAGARAATLDLGGVAPGARLAPGQRVLARWGAPAGAREAELLLSLDGGRTYALRITAESDPAEGALAFRVPNLPVREARVALRADVDGRETIVAASGPFSIALDAAAPAERIVSFGGDLALGEAARGAHDTPLSGGLEAPGPSFSPLGDPLDGADAPALAPPAASLPLAGFAPAPPLARAAEPSPFRASVSRPKRE